MKSSNTSAISLVLNIFLTLIVTSCGLPLYEALDPPRAVSLGSGVNAVGFTSADDDLVDGYVVYYKIYHSGDELILQREEEKQFDPSYYENDNLNELPSGDTLPLQLGFYKLGFVNDTASFNPQLPVNAGGRTVLIDFTDSRIQSSGSDPVIYVDGTNMNNDYGVPARGVKYSDAGSDLILYFNNKTFKRFVKNYEYTNSINYIDADIKQMLSRGGTGVSNIVIAFVVYSYGISNTTLEPLSSIPVHLGTVYQDNLLDNSENRPILD